MFQNVRGFLPSVTVSIAISGILNKSPSFEMEEEPNVSALLSLLASVLSFIGERQREYERVSKRE
jgi:hypothetical protein